VTETIFHIVAEDPQVKHITQEMQPPCMHEHGCEKRWEISNRICQETTGNESPALDKSFSIVEFQKEHQNVQGDQSIGNDWGNSPGTIIITKWYHRYSPSLIELK
jgi:hypothetical protein